MRCLLTDKELERELTDGLKRRDLDQKFRYMGEGAKLFYRSLDARKKEGLLSVETDYAGFIMPYLGNGVDTAMISLGCGDAYREKSMLHVLHENNFYFSYFGVDSSQSMVDLAKDTLTALPIRKSYICADIMTAGFRTDIRDVTASFGRRVLMFLGNTLGNVNQTHIADSLFNTLSPGDLLWFDVSVRLGTSSSDDMTVFNRLAKLLTIPVTMEFYFYPLKSIGVPFENGRMQLTSDREESIGALVLKFSFLFTKKTVVAVGGETVHFLPGEKIDLITIRAYHPETLIRFFQERDFVLLKSATEKASETSIRGQFLFKKSA